MLVREAMNEQIETIEPETTVIEAAQMMRDGDFGALPVMQNDELIGIVTDRDLTIRVLAEQRDPQEVSIMEVMTSDILTCQADDDVQVAAELMADRQVRRLVVLDGEEIAGIISLGDLALMEEDTAVEAIAGISEHRHDEPGQELNH